MELESKKFRNRLIIIAVIIVISLILGTISEKQNKKYADQVDSIVETIQAIPEEQYSEEAEKQIENKQINSIKTKEEALSVMQSIQKYYGDIFKYPESVVILLFTLAFSGTFIGVMMYFHFAGWVLKKFFPDLKKWMSILMRILILIILLYVLLYILITVGVFGQIPYIIYIIYKFIKTKKTEDKGDIIEEKEA